jgi:hypothetical protein
MVAGVQREPRQQRPRAATGRHGDRFAVGLGLQLAEESHAQHGRQAYEMADSTTTYQL